MRNPYTLFKKLTSKGPVWYVRFWNEKAQKYSVTRSTGIIAEGKKERIRDADSKAKEMLSDIRFENDAADRNFISYLEDFWKPDSPYVKECANLKKKPLSVYYVLFNSENVRLHIKPFPGLNKVTLRELTAGFIKDWMTWAVDKGMSGRGIKNCLNAMRVAVRYAVDREELNKDPFRKIKSPPDESKEKGVLTPTERKNLINATITDPRSRLAVLLGLLCGMRRGEVRGLKWGDVDDGLIDLTHNFVNYEGLKKPKCGKIRKVPFPAVVEMVLEEVRKVAVRPSPDNYVFESIDRSGQPMGETFFRKALKRELEGIGITAGKKATEDCPAVPNEQKRRNLTFHSLRHSFITLSRLDGIPDLEVQAIAGHSSREMMEHYSHAEKVIDFKAMREKLDRAVGL